MELHDSVEARDVDDDLNEVDVVDDGELHEKHMVTEGVDEDGDLDVVDEDVHNHLVDVVDEVHVVDDEEDHVLDDDRDDNHGEDFP